MQQLGERPKANLAAIIRFVFYKDIVLTPEQEQLLLRLQFADEKARGRNLSRDQIIKAISTRFGVSDWRADQDISDTHKVFGVTRKLDPNYLLSFHLDDIQQQIQLAKDARRLELLPRLNENYTNALNSIPEDKGENETPPVKIVFIIKGEKEKRSLKELLAEADKLISKSKITNDYIEFEDEPTAGEGS